MSLFFHLVKNNKPVAIIIGIYTMLMVSVLSWGLPNSNHPFVYHMDEWHQLESVRSLFSQWSANVPGAAHGSQLQFIISGLYLAPFVLLGIINPLAFHSPFSDVVMQAKIFEILRLNTLLFGIASILILVKIAKDYLKINPAISILFFTLSPGWLSFSNYFKYDIALVFWLTISLLFLFKYIQSRSFKTFLILCFVSGCAVATKVSALPLFVVLIIAYFYNIHSKKYSYRQLLIGIGIFLLTILFFGFPDILLGKGEYGEFFSSNLITNPQLSNNYILNGSYVKYLLLYLYPANLGHGLMILFGLSTVYWILNAKKNGTAFFKTQKNIVLLYVCLGIFFLSLIPLKLYLPGNRLLVLFPYMALICGYTVSYIYKNTRHMQKKMLILFIIILASIQVGESMIWMRFKLVADPRDISSQWLYKHVKINTHIGIENIPIYQMLPDVLLSDHYRKDYPESGKPYYNTITVNYTSKTLPDLVVITNEDESNFLKESDKKMLLQRLKTERYTKIAQFSPDFTYNDYFNDRMSFYISLLVPSPTHISVFRKD